MTMNRKCPHADVRFCPLYYAGHVAGAPSCFDDDWANGCAAERNKLKYSAAVELLRIAVPGLVEQVEWQEMLETRRGQMARNLKAAGLQ